MFKKTIIEALKEVLNIQDNKLEIIKDTEKARKELLEVKIELEELKAKKEREETEIKHLVKITKEKHEIEFEKKENKVIAEYKQKELDLQKDYHNKINENLTSSMNDIKEMYQGLSKTLGKAVDVKIIKKGE